MPPHPEFGLAEPDGASPSRARRARLYV